MKTLRVNVTKQDIKKGKKEAASSCPIALAIKRITGHLDVCVFDDEAFLYGDSENPTKGYSLSKTTKQFIENFDHGKTVKPATFILKQNF